MDYYTKGPWKHGYRILDIVAPNSTKHIATVHCASEHPATESEAHGNARLIAAAPELYEELRALRARTMALAQALRQKGHSDFVNDWLADGILDCESISKAEGR